MERVLQYLDDLDDAVGMVGLIVERLRRLLMGLFFYLTLCVAALASIGLAVLHPQIALAPSTRWCVPILYRLATTPTPARSQTA